MDKLIAKKLNESIASVVEANTLEKFERAIVYADALNNLKSLLTKDTMKPIMLLQGSKLGFVTDRDDKGGYPIEVVRECLIEAVLRGVEPYGNQFNIIAGNMYITKEGFKYLLDKVPNLIWNITPELPRMKDGSSSAAVVMKVRWKSKGQKEWNEQMIDVAVKVNKYMGTDAVIGKAERKSRAWLYNHFTDEEIVDGDAEEVTIEVVEQTQEKVQKKANKAEEELAKAIAPSKPVKEPGESKDGEINFE